MWSPEGRLFGGGFLGRGGAPGERASLATGESRDEESVGGDKFSGLTQCEITWLPRQLSEMPGTVLVCTNGAVERNTQ